VRTRRAPREKVGARERLLATSSEVFRESGYRAASLDDILRRSGVAKSNFYYHFAGKLELACAAVDLWAEHLGTRLLAPLGDASKSGLERLRGFVAAFEGVCSSGAIGCPFGMLAAEDDLDAVLRERVQSVLAGLEAALAQALREGQRDGSIREDADAAEFAGVLVATVQGAGLIARATREPARIATAANPLLALLAGPEARRARAARR
jgi:TetR/AcrR family transcriptional regulator, transcriptional repressor for nem operon